MRLARTVDLTGVAAGQAPTLAAKLSYDTEEGYDHVIVEAHTVGQDDWTTLPEAGGLTTTTVPTECEVGFLLEEHAFLKHYLTAGNPCTATGTSGSWNSMTGSSDGWQDASFDLSAFAGQQVEVSISYVTDPATGGVGAFVDDTRLVVGGSTVQSQGFETGLAPWALAGAAARQLAGDRELRARSEPVLPGDQHPATPCCSASVSSRWPPRPTVRRSSARPSGRSAWADRPVGG